MKTHTSEFKNKIKEFGREIDSKITYTIDGVTTELGKEELNSVSPHYEGAILKSVMKQLDIDSNVEIPVGTELNYKFGVKTRNGYNLLNVTASSGISHGVTFTVNEDKSITINGTNDGTTSWFRLAPNFTLPAGTYTLSNGNSNAIYTTGIFMDDNHNFATENTTTKTFQYAQNISPYIRVYAGVTINNLTIRPMIVEGSYTSETMPSYEPYGAYDYINYGNYIVKDVEKQEDTYSYKITCYDKMLYAMKDYENSNITFPITVKNYLIAICNKIGLTFKDSNFANYDKIIDNELYLDNEGRSLGYTFRTILDEIAQVSGGTICITDDDKLEVRYLNQTVGKNLLNVDKSNIFSPTTETGFRAIMSVNEGIITFNGRPTTSGGTNMYFNSFQVGESGDYRLSTNMENPPTGSYTNMILQKSSDNSSWSTLFEFSSASVLQSTVVELDKNLYYRLRFYGQSTTIFANTIFKPQLEKGITQTEFEPYGDTIDEEYLKDINVNFGEKFGPVNTIVLSRGGDGDKISLSQPANLPDANKIAIQITDNQIMNGNNRDTYLSALLNKLYRLEYYINDFSSTGICYLDLCDKYNIKIGDKFYNCVMFNDEVNITQGLEELIYTDMQEENEQDYKYIGSTDRGITQANIIANKAEATITSYTQRFDDINNRLNAVEVKQTETDVTIGILGTNIDDDGNITAVKVKEGYTFDENGFQIYTDANSFKTLIDETGTYYYDGTTKVGQYTKDGSKQKDLELFGVYYYGKKIITDDAMFVAQLYNDNDGEEGFGHFYNRGD